MTFLVNQERNLESPKENDFALPDSVGEFTSNSPWRNPVPIEDSNQSSVVVYFYSDRWIPMTCFSLAEAIALYQKALALGKKILVYPASLNTSTAIAPEKLERQLELKLESFSVS